MKVPDEIKCSTTVPFLKVDNRTKFEELGPLNLMQLIDKILEGIVHEYLNIYLLGSQMIHYFMGARVVEGSVLVKLVS